MFKVFAINVAIFFALVGFAEFALPAVYAARQAVRSDLPTGTYSDPRAFFPNYDGVEWAEKHYAEFAAIRATYRSYVGWQRESFNGETITVTGPYAERRTLQGNPEPRPDGRARPSVYFFGGSTTWGTGVNDETTIPSLYSGLSGNPARNFGESAWRPRQSINRLIDLYQNGHRPDVVVFYNGVNHTFHCDEAENIIQHEREGQIAQMLRGVDRPMEGYGLGAIMQTHREFARLLSDYLQKNSPLPALGKLNGCERNPERAQAVARTLVEEWKIAKALAEAHGGTFVAVLQPVSYVSDTPLDHLSLPPDPGYAAVYPLLREYVKKLPWAFDASDVLDVSEYVYVDDCHLSPNGNAYVAARIHEILEGALDEADG